MEDDLIIREHLIRNDLYYGDIVLMTYVIKYPEFYSKTYSSSADKLNIYYGTKLLLYQKFHIKNLFKLAMEEYNESKKQDYPFRAYEVYVDYTVTYNKECILSLYFNKYQYTGGAHGMTNREADTWDLSKAEKIDLKDLYVGEDRSLADYFVNEINRQIKVNIDAGNNYYFENYEELVKEYFNPRNFYINEEGVVIFYQLYEIGPYVSGIMTFTIPYEEGVIELPSCN